jgi:hypothetical protein
VAHAAHASPRLGAMRRMALPDFENGRRIARDRKPSALTM